MDTQPVPLTLAHSLVLMANNEKPREICGFIMDDWSLAPITNVSSRHTDYMMDQTMLKNFYKYRLPKALGIYHSHPREKEEPSDVDWDQWMSVPTGLRYFIVTLNKVVEWKMDGDEPELIARYP